MYDITYMWTLKIQQTSEYSKKEADSDTETELVVTSGERELGKDNIRVGD